MREPSFDDRFALALAESWSINPINGSKGKVAVLRQTSRPSGQRKQQWRLLERQSRQQTRDEPYLGRLEDMMAFDSHEAYFDGVAREARPLMLSIQARVESLLPQASRCISYNMPAFRAKRVFFYFAAFKKHIGVYPPVTGDIALLRELAGYRGEKGNLSFPLNETLPIDLIGRVAVALHREYGAR